MNAMNEIVKHLGSQDPVEVAGACKEIVKKGLDIGHTIGEILNKWIDDLFENFNER